MLICPVCGKMHPQASRNCDVCGAPLAMADHAPAPALATAVEANSGSLSGPICPVCHRANRSASVFCAFCGYRLKHNGGPQPYALPYAGAPAAALDFDPPQVAAHVTGNLPPGTVLKRRYRILRKIAQGGMGAVYESADLTAPPGTRWAVKEISPAALSPAERNQAIADFRREAQMLATLRHPNLPMVVETFEELGKYFLTMEFIPGRTLLNVIDGTPGFISYDRVMAWARQLFDVLQYLHAQNPPIIYRDLKPANVMLVENTERIKLIDFGIARFHKLGKTRDTEAFGTAGYAPPEQYGKGQTDQRSDIYALAATLHHVYTRHDPSLNPFNWLSARRYNPAIPAHIDAALQRALHLDPDRRFLTVWEFASALGVRLLPTEPLFRPQEPAPQPAPAPAPPTPKPAAPKQSSTPQQPKTQSKKQAQPEPQLQVQAEPQPVSQPPVPGPVPGPAPVPVPMPAPVAPPVAPVVASAATPTASTDIRVPTHTGAVPPKAAKTAPPQAKPQAAPKEAKQEPAPAIVVSDSVVDLGESLWNRKPARKVALRSASGASMRGTVIASHPWIAYNPAQIRGNAATLEVKVRHGRLPFGREELQVPNLFAIIWARTRRLLPFIGCWFWVLLLVGSSLGRSLLWVVAATLAALVAVEALMWLWAQHVRLLVPRERLNTGRLTVRSPAGDQPIEVRVLARPSRLRRALGWTMAGLLLVVELLLVTWVGLALAGVGLPVL